MTDLVLVALITGVPVTISAVGTIVNMFLTHQATQHIVETKKEVVTLKNQTDGMQTALVKITGEKAFLEGHAKGLADAGPELPPAQEAAANGVLPETVKELEARPTKPGWWFGKH